MNTESGIFEKVNNWIRNSVTLKLLVITILMLLLLIPISMIETIIREREELNMEVIEEVSSKWADSQQINGPILSVPLIYEFEQDDKRVTSIKYWHILPENLEIRGNVEPEKLRRGIYEVVVYESELHISGDFLIEEDLDRTNLKEIQYDHSFLTIGISDLRGIKENIDLIWKNENYKVKPGSRIPDIVYSGVTIDIADLIHSTDTPIPFEFRLHLQGSQNLSFIPIGSTTRVNLSSGWKAPSFNGNFLPDQREVTQDGFSSSWTVLQINRNFPQSWTGNDISAQMGQSSFGVDLLLPMDDYQKSIRSTKYAVMTVALTFLIFFLVEILNKRKIHPFQYALVGLALSLFYILLVAISEHTDFDLSYALSTLGIASMITLYSLSVFKKRKLTILLLLALVGIYGFLFVTLQLADYALLLGSLGLALILALTMYFTRNINWYNLNTEAE